MANGILTVSRPNQGRDSLRRYQILVDGHEVGLLKPGEQLRLELAEGEHAVLARIDWAGSTPLKVVIAADKPAEIEVGSNVTGWRILFQLFYATFGSSQYLYLRQRGGGFLFEPPTVTRH